MTQYAGGASPNFGHLASISPLAAHLGALAERYVFDDPVGTLVKLRQLGEVLAQEVAARTGCGGHPDEHQHDRLRRLQDARVLEREPAELFHFLRKVGNRATHNLEGTTRESLMQLRVAWRLSVWFQKAFKDQSFSAGPFVPPVLAPKPEVVIAALTAEAAAQQRALEAEVQALKEAFAEAQARAEALAEGASTEAQRRAEAEAAAAQAHSDLAVALELAGESEARAAEREAEFQAALAATQAQAAAAPSEALAARIEQVRAAPVDLDEAQTRQKIDAQLREAGWQADSGALTYANGARPTPGVNQAIAEWPVPGGRADYVLFLGLVPVGLVEAKRRSRSVSGAIEQCKRYARVYDHTGEPIGAGGPWGEYRLPFLFATNGRPYLKQVETESGIWFLDARRSTNHPRALDGWYTPAGLDDLLRRDHAQAEVALASAPATYLNLRDYQLAAIEAAERAIVAGKRRLLLAMATGTGKTRTALGLVYRLLKAGRFRRILFLVDRTSLGEQTEQVFASVQLENLQSLTQIYNVKRLGDLVPDAETRVHFATVQGLVRRVLNPGEAEGAPPVDAYDCIVVDECHRGYGLDQEMGEGELAWRSEAEYISKYRRVLEHFDAVQVGLTATPAVHTVDLFGRPIFEYGYRQAVIDGYLVDHEPPIRILTRLNQQGIKWAQGDEVAVLNSVTGQVDRYNTPDQIQIDVEGFNTQVVTEPFNRAVCTWLAEQIDPDLDGKTLIFCATDAHADLVVALLKAAFSARYGQVEDAAVQKITGAADRPLEALRRFKNERLPNVAVTVDLLTTGVDVPEIVNLVFLRRVKSRILYEQMLGRATRLCPHIDKESFRIFDAVDLYAALAPYSDMKPVVQRPNLSFAQLVGELLTVPDVQHQRQVLTELLGKLQARKRRLTEHGLADFEAAAGCRPEDLVARLKAATVAGAGVAVPGEAGAAVPGENGSEVPGENGSEVPGENGSEVPGERGATAAAEAAPGEASAAATVEAGVAQISDFFREHPSLAGFLDGFKPRLGRSIFVSDHADEVTGSARGYGNHQQPGDYLQGFAQWLQSHNELDALRIVTQRPRALTRAALKALKLQLDQAGYSEKALRAAWHDVSSQDIAASIIGFIRQQVLGTPLLPYDQRVDAALRKVLASQSFSQPQRQWLERIAKQLKVETVVDRAALDAGQFKALGGFARINKAFDGRLDALLGDLHAAVWEDVA